VSQAADPRVGPPARAVAGPRGTLLVLAALLGQPVPAAAAPADAPSAEASPPPARAPAVRVEPTADGGFVAFRGDDPTPIRGADLYRAVLRLDLVERHEDAVASRRAAFVGAGFAVVLGPALGYLFGKARQTPTDQCVVVPRPPECEPSQALLDENDRILRQSVIVGSAVGLGAAAGLAWLGSSIRPPVPDLAEARDLADRYNARQRVTPSQGPGTRLHILPAPGGARLAVEVRFR